VLVVDVDDIKYVINFDYPNSSEDYVHRIGRTARASKRGTSYTFFTIANARQSKDLIEVLREANQQINPKLMQLQEVATAFGGRCNPLFLCSQYLIAVFNLFVGMELYERFACRLRVLLQLDIFLYSVIHKKNCDWYRYKTVMV